MYESFYGLHKAPFRLTPDPYFFFNSHTHKRGTAYLRYAMQQGEGFVVITGEPGTGKTELMFNLINKFDDPHVVFAKIVSTNLQADDLLELVAASFELYTEDLGKGILLKKLENFFIGCARQNKQVFLLIDEAHNLSTASLIELSMLSNFQLGEKAILRCFLLGQEPLEKKLEEPELTHLRQRVIASAHLDPLDEAETAEYIKHRLTRAGWRGDPQFHDNAYPPIHKFTGGIPRQINFFCNRLLLQGYIDELHKIDVGVVHNVIRELLEETTTVHTPRARANENFTSPFPGIDISAHRHSQPQTTARTGTQELHTPAPLLKVVTNQTPITKKPELTSPATNNKSIGTALIACHTNREDTDVLQELVRDGARRLLRTLTQDSQADRELRASVAFYIRAESARLISPDSIQQLNANLPGIPPRPLSARINHHPSSVWKWAAVTSVAVLGVFTASQLQHIDKPVTLSNIAGNQETNGLIVATIAPAQIQDAADGEEGTNRNGQSESITPNGKNSIATPGSAATIDSLQGDNNQVTPKTSFSRIVTDTGPSTTKAAEPLTVEQHKTPETNKTPYQKEKADGIQTTLANNDQTSKLPQTAKSSPRPSKARLPSESQKPTKVSKATDTSAVISSLPSASSLALAKPVTPPIRHEQPSVDSNPVEPTTAAETDIPATDLKILLSKLTSAYETGNLRKLVSVFAENAHSNDKTSLNEIEDDYRKLFAVTDMRKMMISNIQWEKVKNQMHGKGNFQLTVREKGAGRVTSYDGSIKFGVVQSTRGIVITQFDYRYDK